MKLTRFKYGDTVCIKNESFSNRHNFLSNCVFKVEDYDMPLCLIDGASNDTGEFRYKVTHPTIGIQYVFEDSLEKYES